jgi:hypothetical protein
MEKIKFVDFLKENIGMASWTIILVLLGFFQKDLFWIFLLMYVFVVRLFLSDFFQEKTKKNIAKIIWVSVCLIFLAGYYVNNFMPSGEMIDLTEYGCEPGAVSDRQVKSDCYQENLANLQIPKWAKFLKV